VAGAFLPHELEGKRGRVSRMVSPGSSSRATVVSLFRAATRPSFVKLDVPPSRPPRVPSPERWAIHQRPASPTSRPQPSACGRSEEVSE
jgi:hypothetical protein